MLRVAMESVLGLRTEDGDLVVAPCVPDDWPGYEIAWRVPGAGGTRYEIAVANPDGCSETVTAAELDGVPLTPGAGVLRTPLLRDGRTHRLVVTLGARED